MCQWKITETWTCGCRSVEYIQQPGTTCRCTSKITDQGTRPWDGYCKRPECPKAS
ncbi:hypothetical protein FVEN_g12810 [Fusarium venenatum]|nr:hypothetical protein FVEN_g12810 [Fusarium venenatum]